CPFLRQIGHDPGGSLLPSAADGFERLKWTELSEGKGRQELLLLLFGPPLLLLLLFRL
ncbi:unnamed protein product, partial [Didymodactylos carnosus]